MTEVMKLLPAEYHRELTKLMLEQQHELDTLHKQLMKRDGYVIHSIEDD